MTTAMPELAYTRKEAAKALRLGLNSIQNLINSGELPSALICGRRRIRVEDAREFLRRKVEEQKSIKDLDDPPGVSTTTSETHKSSIST